MRKSADARTNSLDSSFSRVRVVRNTILNSQLQWEPQMSILPSTFNRAALCVQWSPHENKFALGGGSRSVVVCYYQEENNWWISKIIKKKHTSSVTCVSWHSNNWLLATGSSDFKCRIFAANISSVDA